MPATPHPALHDAHCHLDFMANGEEVADAARAAGLHIFANTVEPDGYPAACERFAPYVNVHVGLGAHPWWAPRDDEIDPAAEDAFAAEFEQLAQTTRFIGEIGLDFGKRGEGTHAAQLGRLRAIARICARQGGKVLSLHAVKSADAVLDVLDEAGARESCTCIFHWFSASSQELTRAVRAGCLFSVNPMMAATRRGREYLKAIPLRQLLLETDAPPGRDVRYPFADLQEALEEARGAVTAAKGPEAPEALARNATQLFS